MKRIVIANFYPVWPPLGGGQRRIFFLARELSKAFDVEIIVPERQGSYKTIQFGRGLREIRVPVEGSFRSLEGRLDKRVQMAADLAYTLHWRECRLYQEVLAQRLQGASAAITAHPYSAYAILDARESHRVPMIHDSQNMEINQKRSVLAAPDDLEEIRRVEATAIEESALTIACSRDDAEGFVGEYGADPLKIRIVENGVDTVGVPDLAMNGRGDIRKRLDLVDRFVAVFGGSYHHPNFQAIDAIIQLARNLPEMVFLILGTVCRYKGLEGDKPPNIICLGAVDENVKWLAFAISDVGLNPMTEGSGTNIKMLEYAAAGLVVLSTPVGAREVPLRAGVDFIQSELEDMERTLGELQSGDPSVRHGIGSRARRTIAELADWAVIGRRYVACLREVAGGH
jgi:glycosyltransferase involved in cell wall biosynthesis